MIAGDTIQVFINRNVPRIGHIANVSLQNLATGSQYAMLVVGAAMAVAAGTLSNVVIVG